MDIDCLRIMRFIQVTFLAYWAGLCAAGYDEYRAGRHCYSFSNSRREVPQARDICSTAGMELAVINTPEEWQYLSSLHFEDRFWVGATRHVNASGIAQFLWTDGSPVEKHLWDSGEPDKDECVMARYRNGGLVLKTDRCNENEDFLCESVTAFHDNHAKKLYDVDPSLLSAYCEVRSVTMPTRLRCAASCFTIDSCSLIAYNPQSKLCRCFNRRGIASQPVCQEPVEDAGSDFFDILPPC